MREKTRMGEKNRLAHKRAKMEANKAVRRQQKAAKKAASNGSYRTTPGQPRHDRSFQVAL